MRGHDVLGTAFRRGDPHPAFLSLERRAHDHIDHPGDGVGSIERRGSIQQHVNPLDRRRRQGGHIPEFASEPRSGQPAAVDEHQGRRRSEPPEINPRRIDGIRASPIRSGQLNHRRRRPGVVLGQVRQSLSDGSETPPIQRVAVQHHDRRGKIARGFQQRPCDYHLVEQDRAFRGLGTALPSPQKNDPRTRLGPRQSRSS